MSRQRVNNVKPTSSSRSSSSIPPASDSYKRRSFHLGRRFPHSITSRSYISFSRFHVPSSSLGWRPRRMQPPLRPFTSSFYRVFFPAAGTDQWRNQLPQQELGRQHPQP